jgi:hypothetical protein
MDIAIGDLTTYEAQLQAYNRAVEFYQKAGLYEDQQPYHKRPTMGLLLQALTTLLLRRKKTSERFITPIPVGTVRGNLEPPSLILWWLVVLSLNFSLTPQKLQATSKFVSIFVFDLEGLVHRRKR